MLVQHGHERRISHNGQHLFLAVYICFQVKQTTEKQTQDLKTIICSCSVHALLRQTIRSPLRVTLNCVCVIAM